MSKIFKFFTKLSLVLAVVLFIGGAAVSCSDKDELVEEVETPDDNETPDEPENTDDSETTDESDEPEDDESGDEEESDETDDDDSDDEEEEPDDGDGVVPELENGEIAIVGFRGVPPSSVSTEKRGTKTIVENYQIMKDCGFNTNLVFVSSEEDLVEELEAAKSTGMNVIPRLAKFWSESENYVPKYDSHESLLAYYISDGVSDTNYETSKGYIDNIRAAGGTKPCYLYCTPGATASTWYPSHNVSYLDEFYVNYIVPTGTSYLSFQCFEVVNSADGYGTIRGGDTWFEYLDGSHSASLSTGLPFWGFICSVAHWDTYPAPNLAQARLQVNLNLAYGAQGLLFYTYWLTVGDAGNTEMTNQNHHDAPIGWDGDPTDTYYVLQQVLSETKEFNKYFYKGIITEVREVTSVYNKAIVNAPDGAVGASLTTQAGNECLVFVNKSLSQDMTVTYGDDVYTLEPGAMTVFYK